MVNIVYVCGGMPINKEREFDDMAKWYAFCIAISTIFIAVIVWFIKKFSENKRFSAQKNIDKIVAEEKEKLEKHYRELENALCAIKAQELEEFELEKKRWLNRIDTQYQNMNNAKEYHLGEAQRYKEAYNNIRQEIYASILKPIQMSEGTKKAYISALCSAKGEKTLKEQMFFFEVSQIECKVRSSSGETYATSLKWCSCRDQQNRGGVCKHMLSLAIQLGAVNVNHKAIMDEYGEDLTQIWEAKEKIKILEKTIKDGNKDTEKLQAKYKKLKKATDMAEKELQELIEKKCEVFPIFASMYADVYTYYYSVAAKALCDKPRPAKKAAQTIEELRAETQEYLKEKKEMEYKFGALLQLYPDAEKIFNNDFDIDNPPILIPHSPKAVNDKKKNPRGRASGEKQ